MLLKVFWLFLCRQLCIFNIRMKIHSLYCSHVPGPLLLSGWWSSLTLVSWRLKAAKIFSNLEMRFLETLPMKCRTVIRWRSDDIFDSERVRIVFLLGLFLFSLPKKAMFQSQVKENDGMCTFIFFIGLLFHGFSISATCGHRLFA